MDTESATYLIQTEIMSHISPGDTIDSSCQGGFNS